MKKQLRAILKNTQNHSKSFWVSLVGLTVAMLSVFYIYSYVSFEMGYDSYHENADRIYRVNGDLIAVENTTRHAKLGPLLGEGLKNEFPEVEQFARLSLFHQKILFEYENKIYDAEEAYRTDQSVFDVFSFHFIFGQPDGALKGPNKIVINRSLSERIFGHENPVGKSLVHNNNTLTVTGVIADAPANSHHKMNVLFSVPDFDLSKLDAMRLSEGYWMPSGYVFVMLKPNAKIESITNKFEPFYTKYMAMFGKRINTKFSPVFTPLKDLHFSGHMSYDMPKGNKSYSYVLIVVACIIFLVALLNYGHLLVFKYISDSKNLGIRKIIGASEKSLYFRFLIDSVFFVGMATFMALALLKATLPYSEYITAIDPQALFNWNDILIFSVLVMVVIVILASAIPFLYQNRKKALVLLNAKKSSNIKVEGLRFGKSVAVVQFMLSIVLIIVSIGITKQLSFMIQKDMGFDKENVVLVEIPSNEVEAKKIIAFKNELRNKASIAGTSISTHAPGEILLSRHFQFKRNGQVVSKIVNAIGIDYDYLSLMGMEIKVGRNSIEESSADNSKIWVNEAFMNFCGYNDSIVGTKIEGVELVGVVKDACFNSLHNQTEPLLFYIESNAYGYVNVKLNTTDAKQGLEDVEALWRSFFGDIPFNYHFLENRVAMLYENDQKKNMLMQLFAIISIILSAMGFLNLASILNKQRTKEIGIRKVNGARITEVLVMLNGNFIKWVILAFIIASPIAYFAMSKWLENFAYKTSLSWWIFALAGILALGIALFTVTWQSWRAATRNPVEALRYE
ncbi:ABC transporter permease [Prolixibacteraceae bacterium JC049]|nr:ABC transporter permease [Prolixibacteraceae bacterium JC049]